MRRSETGSRTTTQNIAGDGAVAAPERRSCSSWPAPSADSALRELRLVVRTPSVLWVDVPDPKALVPRVAEAVSGDEAAPPRLFVLVGLPATGKTARAREIAMASAALRLTPDEWMTPIVEMYL